MSLMMKATSTKRIRASKPKVRSGCITCKLRRVKCDEARPRCLRCQKFGQDCDGYASDHANARRNSLAPLKPRPSAQTPLVEASPSPEDEQERCYYELFRDRTAVDLAGYYPTDFWKRIALQEGCSEPVIRHAIMALGALTRSTTESSSEPSQMTMDPSVASEKDQKCAFDQYHKAVAELRPAPAMGRPQIRTALIACLLLVCFQNFHGDDEAAERHMQCGLGLLDQWQAAKPTGHIADLYSEEVFQIFARYNAQSAQHLGFTDTRNPSPKLFYWESIGKRVVPIPLIFINVHEARLCWDVLQERCIDYHQQSNRYQHTTEKPHWLIAEADACALQLQQFEDTIWPLVNPQGDTQSLTLSGAIILYIRNKISAMQLQISVVRGEHHWDVLTPQFVEVLAQASTIIERSRSEHLQPSSSFSLDIGILPALHLCATKCRQPRLRRRAIALLQAYPHREAGWDGLQLAKLDEWIMCLEEEGIDALGQIPEAARWRLDAAQGNRREGWVWGRVVRDPWDGIGEWNFGSEVREKRIPV